MIYEPGPFAIRTTMPLGPRVVPPGHFLSDVAAIGGTFVGVEAGLSVSVSTIGPLASLSLDGAYNADVAPAFTNLDLFDTPAENAEFARLAGAADTALNDAAHQVLDLPGAGENTPGTITGTTPDPGDVPGFD